jgi:large subunit ribosomal protein L4e
MKVDVLGVKGDKTGSIDLPEQFGEQFRPDLINRAAVAVASSRVHPYGAHPDAGKRASAKVSRRRRNYRGSYGLGISRVPRKVLSHRGTRFNWVGAFAPGTVGGRPAHPPIAGKVREKFINDSERRKAIRCAFSASMIKDVVGKKHELPANYPFAVSGDVESVSKTKDFISALKSWGLSDELERAGERRLRAGRGKYRGRVHKVKIGPLVVVSKACALEKLRNIPVDVVEVKRVNALDLAPGCNAGRLVLFTDSSLKVMKEEKLFM